MNIRKVRRVVPNLKDKKTYAVHIKSLNEAMKHDLKFKKVHRVTLMEQSSWMKPDIMLNTKLRNPEKNEFEKNFFETMNNSLFRKDSGKYYEP